MYTVLISRYGLGIRAAVSGLAAHFAASNSEKIQHMTIY